MNKQQIIEFAANHAPHVNAAQLDVTYNIITDRAKTMDDEAKAAEIEALTKAAEQAYAQVKCWSMWDAIDHNRTHKQSGDEYSAMAAIWVMV